MVTYYRHYLNTVLKAHTRLFQYLYGKNCTILCMMASVDCITYVMHKSGNLGKLYIMFRIPELLKYHCSMLCHYCGMDLGMVGITKHAKLFIALAYICKDFLIFNNFTVFQIYSLQPSYGFVTAFLPHP